MRVVLLSLVAKAFRAAARESGGSGSSALAFSGGVDGCDAVGLSQAVRNTREARMVARGAGCINEEETSEKSAHRHGASLLSGRGGGSREERDSLSGAQPEGTCRRSRGRESNPLWDGL